MASPSRPVFIPEKEKKEEVAEPSATAVADTPTQRLGIVFNLNKKTYPYFTLDVVTGEPNDANDAFAGTVEKMDISRYVNTDQLPEADREMLGVLRKLQESEINKYISRNSPFSGIWENIIHHEDDDLPDETKELMAEYLLPKLKKMFLESASSSFVFVLPEKKAFKTNNLVPLQLQAAEAKPHFIVKKNAQYSVQCRVKAGGIEYDLSDNESPSPLLFLYNEQAWLWSGNEVIHLVEKFLPSGKMSIPADEWEKTLTQFILPLTREHKVDFDKSLVQEVRDGDPEVKLFLLEKGEYLVF